MCGIVGYIGKQKALPVLIDGIKSLEYRGYDSAGFAVSTAGGVVKSKKAVGRVSNLELKIEEKDIRHGNAGICHTRWATHGGVTEENAHPHSDAKGELWLCHNGIIENYKDFKSGLARRGHTFKSETDSEVLAHLIEEFKIQDPALATEEAVRLALLSVRGTYGLALLDSKNPGTLIAARNFSPLLIGVGDGEYIIASDASAVLKHTKNVVYLDDGEMAVLTPKSHKIFDLKRNTINRKSEELTWDIEEAQKGGNPHFMLKEILEEYGGIPVKIELASEFRYRKPIFREGDVMLVVSQSGETADTLAALAEAKQKGVLSLGIVNVVGSTIARQTDAGVYQHVGPEIGVASTKAFTSQVAILALLSVMLGRQRDMSVVMARRITEELSRIPELMKKIIKQSEAIKKLAKKYQPYRDFLFLGRKYNYPVALEGALKLKEISYVHAEGFSAGEMKHGPIAMI